MLLSVLVFSIAGEVLKRAENVCAAGLYCKKCVIATLPLFVGMEL